MSKKYMSLQEYIVKQERKANIISKIKEALGIVAIFILMYIVACLWILINQ